ncbi:hypothetical protein [Methylocella sp.]|uniref:hypothetical protein n=1 Tax=Methylocella sp. TaxID=1978226 RepID=UPI003783273D
MLFSIDQDSGERVIGWLMPDNPATAPRIVVHLGADRRVTVEASIYRPLLKEQGLHNTGVCGFVVEESNCPGVSACADLEIRDGDANVLIYRRRLGRDGRDDDLVDGRFLRLETQLLRLSGLDEIFLSRFQMAYRSLELLSEETIRAVCSISFSESVFGSGRLHWRAFEPVLRDRGFKVGALLRDPFEELSERILILKWASGVDAAATANVLMPDLQTCVGHFRAIDIADVDSLDALLAEPPDELRQLLANPLVAQLAAPNAFDPPPQPCVAAALDALATLDVVALHEDVDAFLTLAGAVLDLDRPLPSVSLDVSPTVQRLATLLRDMASANELIRHDAALYAEARRVLAAPVSA